MRVIFMGTPAFAVPTLDALVQAGHEVVLVVGQPDKPVGRGRKLTSPPVAARAKELGLPLSQPRAIRSGSFPNRVKSLDADVAVVLAYGRILTSELLNAPKHGCINVHASLLPRWRGAAPIQAAILHGDDVTGVCTQQMEEGLDTGPVFDEERMLLDDAITAGELHDALMVMSAEVAVRTLELLEQGATPTPQDDSQATHAPKISKADGVVSFDQPAVQISRRVRAMSPWPGGQVQLADHVLKIKALKVVEGEGKPGEILSVSPLVVACGEGALELTSVQAPGRKAVSGADYANGRRLNAGDVLA